MTSEQKGPHRSDRVRLGKILLGPVLTFVAYMIAPQDLPPAALGTLLAAVWTVTWWVTEAIPIPAASLLPAVLLPVFGVCDAEVAAKQKAQADAFLKCIEKVVGIMITSEFTSEQQEIVKNNQNDFYANIRDQLSKKSKGFIKTYEVLKEEKSGDIMKVTVKAQVFESKLKAATKAKERVMLFCHFPVHPANVHNLWNHSAITELLAKYPCVTAYLNGHNHAGNYGEKNGIHYLSLKGMVDTEKNSYSVMEVHADRLILKGFGRQENREMKLSARVKP